MKIQMILFLLLATAIQGISQDKSAARKVLLEQLKKTHNVKDWFVPVNTAVEGLTAAQAAWKDKGNHSCGQLAYHLLFWNERSLKNFMGEKNADFTGSNEETFDKFDEKQWADIVMRLDHVMTDIEKWVETAPEDQLAKHYGTLANISTHNAYHTGQIVTVRKAQGSWDPAKGVK